MAEHPWSHPLSHILHPAPVPDIAGRDLTTRSPADVDERQPIEVGSLVAHTTTGPAGDAVAYGTVVETTTVVLANGATTGAACVAWTTGGVSGPIPVRELVEVT